MGRVRYGLADNDYLQQLSAPQHRSQRPTNPLYTCRMSLNDLYDKLADAYEDLVASPEVDSQLTKKVSEVFNKYEIKEGTILDLGCGPGNLKNDLEGTFVFTGVDPSRKMLEQAEKKHYQIIEGKIEDVLQKIPDNAYDYVVAVGCLLFIEDVLKALSEIDRVARKAWVVSLDDITERYARSFLERAQAPAYNHSKIEVSGATEDIHFDSWKAKGEQMTSRLIFKIKG
jgi:ubiquinone/menaquinone biosynthesis C-methylase UbiE